MIKFENVTKKYSNGQIVALENINFEISKGEFISVVGRSGAGKSTLLSMITLQQKPETGRVLIEGQDIKTIKPAENFYLRRKIGVVYQDMKLLSARTAAENVAFAMEVCGFANDVIERDAPKILDLVGLRHKMHAFPKQLSGGEKQRVAIARALAHKPVLLIADEPTGNLDDDNAWEIIQLLLKINKFGTTVLLATHASHLVNQIKRRVITIENGEIIYDQEEGTYVL